MKHPYLSKRYWKNKNTAMSESEAKLKDFDDIINLSIGDTDLITDHIIIDGAFADAKLGHTRYTETRGDPELRQEISSFYREEYAIEVPDAEIMVTTSGCIAMFLTLEAILDDGDEVIVPTPCFTPYLQQIELARGIPVQLPTLEEERFQINADRLQQAITARTKAIILNTPCNPTGICQKEETLTAVARIAKEHDLLVIADDIYTLFSYEQPFSPIAALPGMRERTITINSFSKNFLMTGWRIGSIVAPDYIIDTVRMINENVAFTSPSVSQRGAIHALRNRKKIQPGILAEYRGRVMLAAKRINEITKLSVLPPEGTFYLFPNIRETGMTSQQAAQCILEQAHVVVLPGDAFGSAGEGYLRLALTRGQAELNEAFDRIANIPAFQ